jgi:putative heme iron utilization protein
MASNELRALVADDGYAVTFQTMSQYRTALMHEIDKMNDCMVIKDLIGRDGFARAFDRMGKYRTALLAVIDSMKEAGNGNK